MTMQKTTITTTPVSGVSGAMIAIAQPMGGVMAFGLGIAGLAVSPLHMTQQLAIGLIVSGLAVFHVTVSNITG